MLLLKSEDHSLLIDVPRFGEDGGRLITFEADLARLSDGSEFEVLVRTATWEGMARILEEDPSVVHGGQLQVRQSELDLAAIKESPFVRAHAVLLTQLAKASGDLLRCVQCGLQVSDERAVMVEVEETSREPEVGLVLQPPPAAPPLRVTGRISAPLFAEAPELTDFDYRTWAEQLPRGQAMLAGAQSLQRGPIQSVLWNATRRGTPVGTGASRTNRPTGAVHYVTERGQVIRFSKQEAEACCVDVCSIIDQAAKRKDPLCVLEQGQGYAFAPYSVLVAVSGSGGQDVHRVESVEPQRVTRAILDAHNEADNWYAPLFLPRDEEEGTIITLPGAVVLLSNPLQLSAKLENWRHAGNQQPAVDRYDDP